MSNTWVAFLPVWPSPFRGLALPNKAIELGNGVKLAPNTTEIREAQFVKDFGRGHRTIIQEAEHVLWHQYEAGEWGEPDAGWGSVNIPAYTRASLRIDFASLSLFLARPISGAHGVVVHMPLPRGEGEKVEGHAWRIGKFIIDQPATDLTLDDLTVAGGFCKAFGQIEKRRQDPWFAAWTLIHALREPISVFRIVHAWTGLESLFSPSDQGELRYRMSLYIACLLGGTPEERLKICRRIKKTYDCRSMIVHGSARMDPKNEKRIAVADKTSIGTLVMVLKKILRDPDLLEKFRHDKQRVEYLDRLVFSAERGGSSLADAAGTLGTTA